MLYHAQVVQAFQQFAVAILQSMCFIYNHASPWHCTQLHVVSLIVKQQNKTTSLPDLNQVSLQCSWCFCGHSSPQKGLIISVDFYRRVQGIILSFLITFQLSKIKYKVSQPRVTF